MTLITLLNAHLAAGILALLAALAAGTFEAKAPSLARKTALGGMLATLLVFAAALVDFELHSPFATREFVVPTARHMTPDVATALASTATLDAPISTNSTLGYTPPRSTDSAGIALLAYAGFLFARLVVGLSKLLKLRRVVQGFVFIGRFRQVPFGFGEVASPCVVGVVYPRIFLPRAFGELPTDQQLAVLHHEKSHVTHRHSGDLALRELVRIVLGWFWPVRVLLTAHDRAVETECDLDTAKELGEGISLARALVHFSSCSRQSAICGLALVNAGTSLERRIHRLLSERKTMNINILTQITIATGVLAGAAIASQSLQVKNAGDVPTAAKEAAKLANLAVGHQWTYEYSWPGVKPNRFVLHAVSAVPVADGVVYELKNHSTSFNGTPTLSYTYRRIRPDGVGDTPNAKVSNTVPGFTLSSEGPQIPSDLKPGKKWSWGATSGINTGGPASASLFTGEVMPSRQIDTPLGKRLATVIAITEKVQWDVSTRISYYVAGVGKVREELSRQGKIVQLLQLKDFKASAKAPAEPRYIDSRPGK